MHVIRRRARWTSQVASYDPEETVDDAVRRELREETGLEATEVRLLFSIPNVYPYSGVDVYTADLFYLTRVKSFDGGDGYG